LWCRQKCVESEGLDIELDRESDLLILKPEITNKSYKVKMFINKSVVYSMENTLNGNISP